MDYVVMHWQEIISILIVMITVILFIKREVVARTRRAMGLCEHDEHCAISKIQSIKR
jgi:hypothetical protein